MATDITQRRQLEERLRQSEEQFRLLSEAAPLAQDALAESEQRYRVLMKIAGDAIFIADAQTGIITDCNEQAARFLGIDADRIIGMHHSQLHPPEEQPRAGEGFAKYAQGISGEDDTLVRRADGSTVWANVTTTFFEIAGRRYVQGVFRDITQRKLAQEALRRSETFLSSIIDQTPVPTWIADVNGTAIRQNAAHRELLGIDSDEQILGKYNLFQDPVLKELGFLSQVHDVFEKGHTAQAIIDYDFAKVMGPKVPRARRRVLKITVFPVKDAQGNVTAAVVQHEDVTSRRAAQKALLHYANRLEILREVEHAIATAQSVQEIACAALVRVRQLVPCMRASVAEITADGHVHLLAVSLNEKTQICTGIWRTAEEFGLTAELYEGKPRIAEDFSSRKLCAVEAQLFSEGVRSVAIVPLISCTHADDGTHESLLIGTLNIGRDTPGPFSKQHLQIAQELADLLSLALERKRGEQALREQRDYAQTLVESAQALVIVLAPDGRLLKLNRLSEQLLGRTEEALVASGANYASLVPLSHFEFVGRTLKRIVDNGQAIADVEVPLLGPDGQEIPVLWAGSALRDATGQIIGILAIGRDLTEIRRKEDQLRQAQKMEAVGLLAGGIAHDFNNQLTIIKGFSDVLLREMQNDASPEASRRYRQPMKEIRNAAQRAANLTNQLMVFSRRQALRPTPVDVRQVLTGLATGLRQLVGSTVTVQIDISGGVGRVIADRAQLEQAIINLAANARDAMPDGGAINIRARRIELGANVTWHRPWHDPFDATQENAEKPNPGAYALLEVSDTGMGMDADTLGRVFDPFFTTKPVGKGTGLGLAMVYSFIRQSGGHLNVTSQPGQGSTFSVYLPLVRSAT